MPLGLLRSTRRRGTPPHHGRHATLYDDRGRRPALHRSVQPDVRRGRAADGGAHQRLRAGQPRQHHRQPGQEGAPMGVAATSISSPARPGRCALTCRRLVSRAPASWCSCVMPASAPAPQPGSPTARPCRHSAFTWVFLSLSTSTGALARECLLTGARAHSRRPRPTAGSGRRPTPPPRPTRRRRRRRRPTRRRPTCPRPCERWFAAGALLSALQALALLLVSRQRPVASASVLPRVPRVPTRSPRGRVSGRRVLAWPAAHCRTGRRTPLHTCRVILD